MFLLFRIINSTFLARIELNIVQLWNYEIPSDVLRILLMKSENHVNIANLTSSRTLTKIKSNAEFAILAITFRFLPTLKWSVSTYYEYFINENKPERIQPYFVPVLSILTLWQKSKKFFCCTYHVLDLLFHFLGTKLFSGTWFWNKLLYFLCLVQIQN